MIESASLPTLKDPSKFNPKEYFHEVWFLILPSSMETPQYFFYKNQWLALYGWLKMVCENILFNIVLKPEKASRVDPSLK
jgi:hypothetical protein